MTHAELVRQALISWQQGHNLSRQQATEFLHALTDSQVPTALSAGALIALNMKGIVAPELQGFADGMRALASRPNIKPDAQIVDIVGTGGDNAHSFNLSTGAALLAAAAGFGVVKHGNLSLIHI